MARFLEAATPLGADLAIPQLAYFPAWGFPPCRVTREIAPPADLVG